MEYNVGSALWTGWRREAPVRQEGCSTGQWRDRVVGV